MACNATLPDVPAILELPEERSKPKHVECMKCGAVAQDARIACVHCDASLPRPFSLTNDEAELPDEPKVAYFTFSCPDTACEECKKFEGFCFLPSRLADYRIPIPGCKFPVCWCGIWAVFSERDAADTVAFLERSGGAATLEQICAYLGQMCPGAGRSARARAAVDLYARAERVSPERAGVIHRGGAGRQEEQASVPPDAQVRPDAADARGRVPQQVPKIRGYIGRFGLGGWWLAEFTEDERQNIQSRYGRWVSVSDPSHEAIAFDGRHMLVEAEGIQGSDTAAAFLANLAQWLNTPSTRDLARRVLEKAEAVCSDALDRHHVYEVLIPVYYKDRDKDRKYLDTAIRACERHIEVSSHAMRLWRAKRSGPAPTHKGFEQLAIIREKEGDYQEAIRLSRQAIEQGWSWKAGWERRIQRCERKLARVTKVP